MNKLFAAGVLAITVNSCNDLTVVSRMKAASEKSEQMCSQQGGVPIWEMNEDANNGSYFQTLAHCEFPQNILKDER